MRKVKIYTIGIYKINQKVGNMKYSRLWEVEGFKAIAPYKRVLKALISPDLQGSKNVSVGMTLLPSGSKSSYHAHEGEEEIWFVTSGRGKAIVGEESIPIEKDTAIYVPPGVKHQLVNTSDETLKVLWIFSPPGPEKAFIGKKMGRA